MDVLKKTPEAPEWTRTHKDLAKLPVDTPARRLFQAFVESACHHGDIWDKIPEPLEIRWETGLTFWGSKNELYILFPAWLYWNILHINELKCVDGTVCINYVQGDTRSETGDEYMGPAAGKVCYLSWSKRDHVY